MATTTLPRLSASGHVLDTAPEAFGRLESSAALLGDPGALRFRMASDGYLYLPGYFLREDVREARRAIVERLEGAGYLDAAYPPDDLVAGDPADVRPSEPDLFSHMPNSNLAVRYPALHSLLYGRPMIGFFDAFLGGPVRHFDFTWMRVMLPGRASPPHCDIVYMGRGTTDLFTAWTPLGDIPYEMGGLIILENSHLHSRLRENYGRKDVDAYCVNRRDEGFSGMGGGGNIRQGGSLSHNPVKLRENLGGRWLSAEFQAGDLLVFGMYTVHASLDNGTNRIRLSTDTRYQLAAEPADERWVGENPSAHGAASKRGFIC